VRILIASEDKTLGEYLNNQGHETKTIFVNDIAVYATQHFSAEVVIYFTSVVKTENHEDVIKALCSSGKRVILVAEKDDPIRAFAAALGVTDLMSLPVEPADVLHRLENPASKEEAAETMRQVQMSPLRGQEQDEKKQKLRLPKIPLWGRKKEADSKQTAGKPAANQPDGEKPELVAVEKALVPAIEAEIETESPKAAVPEPLNRRTAGISRWLSRKTVTIQSKNKAKYKQDSPLSYQEEKCTGEPTALQTQSDVTGDSCRDILTGCYNRRYLTEVCTLYGLYSVVFIDLDGFKLVNDILGHDAGDKVLSAFGRTLEENLKGQDIAVRWGGDEFVLVLPETAPRDAEAVVENLRAAWDKAAPYMGSLRVGFSAGISSGKNISGLQEAIKEADRLMYSDKKVRKMREAWGPPKTNLPVMPELPESIRLAAKKGMVLAVNVIAVAGLVSAVVWTSDYILRLFGGYSPYLHEAVRVVEWFWKMVYTGLTGRVA